MRRVSYSHNPTIYQINSISLNLREKFNRTFNVEVCCWTYSFNSNNEIDYKISMQPALNGSSCAIKYFSSWKELLSWYLKVMKEGLLSE